MDKQRMYCDKVRPRPVNLLSLPKRCEETLANAGLSIAPNTTYYVLFVCLQFGSPLQVIVIPS